VKAFFFTRVLLKGDSFFYADAGKIDARAYLFVFIFRNAKRRPIIVRFTWAREDTTRLAQFSCTWKGVEKAESRKRLSRRRQKRALFRFTSDPVAHLRLRQRLASISEVENRRKKWLTFVAKVSKYVSYFISGWKRNLSISCGFVVLEIFKFCSKPDDAKNATGSKTIYSWSLVWWEKFSAEDNIINSPKKNEYYYRGLTCRS